MKISCLGIKRKPFSCLRVSTGEILRVLILNNTKCSKHGIQYCLMGASMSHDPPMRFKILNIYHAVHSMGYAVGVFR